VVNQFSLVMLALIRGDTEAGDKDDGDKPKEEPEPVDGVAVGDGHEPDRLARYHLRREYADYQAGNYAECQKCFLPDIHGLSRWS